MPFLRHHNLPPTYYGIQGQYGSPLSTPCYVKAVVIVVVVLVAILRTYTPVNRDNSEKRGWTTSQGSNRSDITIYDLSPLNGLLLSAGKSLNKFTEGVGSVYSRPMALKKTFVPRIYTLK